MLVISLVNTLLVVLLLCCWSFGMIHATQKEDVDLEDEIEKQSTISS